jgi:hypothetical protein
MTIAVVIRLKMAAGFRASLPFQNEARLIKNAHPISSIIDAQNGSPGQRILCSPGYSDIAPETF